MERFVFSVKCTQVELAMNLLDDTKVAVEVSRMYDTEEQRMGDA